MEVRANYLDAGPYNVKYLFFLLTEDYIQETEVIRNSLSPLIDKFGKDLASVGSVIKPKRQTASKNLTHAINTGKVGGFEWSFQGLTPALLILQTELSDFKPGETEHIVISLRDSMDEFGHLKIFEIDELFNLLSAAAHEGQVFERVRAYLANADKAHAKKELNDSINLKLSFMGMGIDLKQAWAALKDKPSNSRVAA